MNDLSYKEKYEKYKQKYLNLKLIIENSQKNSEINSYSENLLTGGKKKNTGEKYICNPKNKFSEICSKESNGKYNSNKSCINDCENQYINYNLVQAKIKGETVKFNLFINDLLEEGYEVYLKGGTVLGLKILKMIYDLYSEDNFERYFNDFLELDLIRDWDFVAYTGVLIEEDLKEKLNKMAYKYSLVPRAKTFVLYQTKYPIKLNDQALFEISIMDKEIFSNLELPLTTMKMKVTKYNLKYIFMFAKSFYSYKVNKTPIDIDVITHMVKGMNFYIYPNKNGLFTINKENYNVGSLKGNIIKFIKDFSKKNINLEQFLMTQIQEPNRLFYRLLEKNIPKVEKIINFFDNHKIQYKKLTWLLNTQNITNTVDKFIEKLGNKIYDIYNNEKDPIEGINAISDFMDGVFFRRIEIEYDNIGEKGKDLIKKLFIKLYNKLPNNILNDERLKDNKFIDCIKFLEKNNLFST
jgi:hypothetical protein